MVVHPKVIPQRYVASTHLCTWVERDKVEQSFFFPKKQQDDRDQVGTTLQDESLTRLPLNYRTSTSLFRALFLNP